MSSPDIQKQVENAVRRLNTLYTRTLPVKVGTKAVSLTKKRFSDSERMPATRRSFPEPTICAMPPTSSLNPERCTYVTRWTTHRFTTKEEALR